MINIAGLDKAAVLAALVNAAQPLGMGALHSASVKQMTVEEARTFIDGTTDDPFHCKSPSMIAAGEIDVDYVWGRPIKVHTKNDEFDPRLYDRDQGQGAAARAVDNLHTALVQ